MRMKEYKMIYPQADKALECYYKCLEIYKSDYALAKEISKKNEINFKRAYYAVHQGRWKHKSNNDIIEAMKFLYG